MKILRFAAFLLLSAGILALFHIRPADFIRGWQDLSVWILKLSGRKTSMKKQIRRSKKKRRSGGLRAAMREIESVLKLTHRTERLRMYSMASVFLFFAGAGCAVLLQNYFLLPVLSIGFSLLPWLYILFFAVSFRKKLNEELETALSMITASYLRSDNIIFAVKENINNIHYPIREIFDKFLIQSEKISSDIPQLLAEMRNSLDNDIFQEWVDQLILCQDNRTLKSTLQPIVSRLSNVREVSGKLETWMYEPIKEFISMAAILVLNPLIIRMMSADWYRYLTQRPVGQIIVAASAAAVFISLIAAVKKTKPVEYRR